MTFITKKHLSRRTFLRGAGVTIALPLLDSMVPAQTPLRANGGRCRRAVSAASMSRTARPWTSGRPPREGTGFDFTETLKPLETFRDHVCVVSNLAHATRRWRRLRRGRRPRALGCSLPERCASRERREAFE